MDLGIVSSAAGAATGGPGLAATAGALGAEAGSAWYANRMSEKRQHEAFDQQKWMMENRYQMQVRDLQKAGLNPMLAYGQPAPMPGSVGQAQVTKPELVSAMSQGTVASAQAGKIRQETENLKVENNNLQNTGYLLLRQYQKTQAEIDEIDQRIKTNKASEKEINRKTELLDIQKELVKVQAMLGTQELNLKAPEEVASSTRGAEVSATISRILKPLIDMLGGAARVAR